MSYDDQQLCKSPYTITCPSCGRQGVARIVYGGWDDNGSVEKPSGWHSSGYCSKSCEERAQEDREEQDYQRYKTEQKFAERYARERGL